jgi:hypothetical protein
VRLSAVENDVAIPDAVRLGLGQGCGVRGTRLWRTVRPTRRQKVGNFNGEWVGILVLAYGIWVLSGMATGGRRLLIYLIII